MIVVKYRFFNFGGEKLNNDNLVNKQGMIFGRTTEQQRAILIELIEGQKRLRTPTFSVVACDANNQVIRLISVSNSFVMVTPANGFKIVWTDPDVEDLKDAIDSYTVTGQFRFYFEATKQDGFGINIEDDRILFETVQDNNSHTFELYINPEVVGPFLSDLYNSFVTEQELVASIVPARQKKRLFDDEVADEVNALMLNPQISTMTPDVQILMKEYLWMTVENKPRVFVDAFVEDDLLTIEFQHQVGNVVPIKAEIGVPPECRDGFLAAVEAKQTLSSFALGSKPDKPLLGNNDWVPDWVSVSPGQYNLHLETSDGHEQIISLNTDYDNTTIEWLGGQPDTSIVDKLLDAIVDGLKNEWSD